MTAEFEAIRARRYLLGESSEEASSALEQEYFKNDAAIDAIAAAEDDLIYDYLADRLGPEQHGQFEQFYMANPEHRQRIAIIRGLSAAASRPTGSSVLSQPSSSFGARGAGKRMRLRYAALAAAATVLLAVGAMWMRGAIAPPGPTTAQNAAPTDAAPPPPTRPQSSAQPAAAPVVVAISLSPNNVRSAGENPTVIVAPGIDVVAVTLEGTRDNRSVGMIRAVVTTVAGNEIWRGPVTTPSPAGGIVGRVDIPADRLRPDDYLIALFTTDASGGETEGDRYFLRVRKR